MCALATVTCIAVCTVDLQDACRLIGAIRNSLIETFFSYGAIVPAKVVISPNVSRGYIWSERTIGQTYPRDTFGLTYVSAKHKVCNLKNYHNTKLSIITCISK